MIVSYCTTCHDRLWQLKRTINHNLSYTKTGIAEICVLVYNDLASFNYLSDNYAAYIKAGRLRLLHHIENKVFNDGSRWSCGYVKHLAHGMAHGRVLFNLDADNFIDDDLHAALLVLQPNELIITKQSQCLPDGRSGRVGVHSELYGKVIYRDRGRADDGDFIAQCLKHKVKIKQIPCYHKPIANHC